MSGSRWPACAGGARSSTTSSRGPAPGADPGPDQGAVPANLPGSGDQHQTVRAGVPGAVGAIPGRHLGIVLFAVGHRQLIGRTAPGVTGRVGTLQLWNDFPATGPATPTSTPPSPRSSPKPAPTTRTTSSSS